MADSSEPVDVLAQGPVDGVQYPLDVVYCGECSLPLEYCEYSGDYDKCKAWLEKTMPDLFEKLNLAGGADGDGAGGKKRQTRGGKNPAKAAAKKRQAQAQQKVALSRAPRGKKKFVTVVQGLATFDIDLKTAAKYFAQRFSCGSSVTGDDEIVIQGDVKDELFDIIPEKWPEIDEDLIDDLGDQKR